jgi:uncharacterized protein YdiU (UPF0061 family)
MSAIRSPQIFRHERSAQADEYDAIRKIDGRHPWQNEVPASHVLYRARKRKNGKVAWFNFSLAKEMGLVSREHPELLTADLEKALLDTFAIQIINEYDIMNGTKIDPQDIKPYFYMATRYLQLQHPGRTGLTSGDGRSIWNGSVRHQGQTWDISSCGTGATCLSPATHIYKKFFRTGDPAISYGCGYSDLDDGIMGAMFSEILHLNGHETERCLAVIEFPGNLSINVRAGKNLLRPSHFFNHLKQGHRERLKHAVDFFIRREIANKNWPKMLPKENPYKVMTARIAEVFAKMAARFESDYIFCWLAWDGDNILCNGGIIDYGSIRQFGLFHHEYRYDDVERWSTTITEQKAQARYLVQTFAQIEDFINTGKKRPVQAFKNHPELKRFDRLFTATKRQLLLEKLGISAAEAAKICLKNNATVKRFEKVFTWFERQTRKTKKPYKTADGVTRDALYSMRDICRVLPQKVESMSDQAAAEKMLRSGVLLTDQEFMETISSSYCRRRDRLVTPLRSRKIKSFQNLWCKIMLLAARERQSPVTSVANQVASRSRIINRYERITGDAICHVGERIIKRRGSLERQEVFKLMKEFIHSQVTSPEGLVKISKQQAHDRFELSEQTEKIMKTLLKTVRQLRDGI